MHFLVLYLPHIYYEDSVLTEVDGARLGWVSDTVIEVIIFISC